MAIILNDITARLRNSDVKWQLPDNEMNILRLEWAKNTIGSVEQIIEHYNNMKNTIS